MSKSLKKYNEPIGPLMGVVGKNKTAVKTPVDLEVSADGGRIVNAEAEKKNPVTKVKTTEEKKHDITFPKMGTPEHHILLNEINKSNDTNVFKKDYTLNDLSDMAVDFGKSYDYLSDSDQKDRIILQKAKNVDAAFDNYIKKNGALPDNFATYHSNLKKAIADTNNVSIRAYTPGEQKKRDYVDNTLMNLPLSKTGIKIHKLQGQNAAQTEAFVKSFEKNWGSKSVNELTDEDVGHLVINGFISLEDIKNNNPDLYFPILKKYQSYTSSDMNGLHDFQLFVDNTARSAGQALEGVGRGVVNTFAAGADALVTDDEISEKIDTFIKNNRVSEYVPEKYKYMPEGMRTASELIGSSAQLLPTIGLSLITPGAGMALIGTQAFGNSYSQARREGASKTKSALFGLVSAGTEIAIERLCSSFAIKGTPVSSQIINRVSSSVKSQTGQKFVRLILEAGGEGFEEVLSYYAEPLAKKYIYAHDSKLDYSLEGMAYSFAGGFIGSAIFGGGADILGARQGPATEASREAELSVKKLQTELVKNGFSNMKKVSKLLSEAESLVKQASWYDNESQKFVLPENLATIFEDAKTVKYNPKTIEAVKLGEKYKGVTPGKVDFEVKDYAEALGNKKSIVTLPDGKKFVKASRKVISGDNPETWASDVMKYINNEIRHGKDVTFTGIDGEVLTITEDTAGKARTRNVVTEKGGISRLNTDDEYALKLRVESHIDEISQVSRGNNAPLTPDKKNHPFAKDGFKYRTAFFEDFDGQYYRVRLSVGHNGEIKTVYNVGKIKLEGDPPGGSKAARQNAAHGVTPSNRNILSQQNPIVNAKLTISHKTQLALNALAKFTGVNVGFANNVTDADGRAVDGVYDSATKQITLSLNAQKPILFTAVHESMHHLRSYNPQLYAFLSGNIFSMYKNNPQAFDVLFGEVGARYAGDINGLSAEAQVDYLSEELMSDLMAEVMCSSKGLSALAGIDRNAFQKIYDSVISVFDYMTGRYKNLSTEHSAEMQDAIDVILEEKKAFIDMYADAVNNYSVIGTSVYNGDSVTSYLRGHSNGNLHNNQQSHYDYSKSFSDQIDDFLLGKFPKSDTFVVGPTEDIYIGIGFNPLPMTIAQGHVKVALDKNSDAEHYLGETVLKQLPDAIKKPVAIIRSKTRPDRVVALLPILQNNKTVITPFEIDGWGKQNNIVIDSNAITTTFGKTNVLKQLKNAIENDSNNNIELFYWNKKEAVSLLQKAGLQLPGILPQDGFVHSIREKGANINIRFENVTETQQFNHFFGKSKAVNADGTPMMLYHQTDADISVFDTRHDGAGSSDNETPFGVFLKPTDADIGLKGKKQMPVYASIEKPLTALNRADLVAKISSLSPEYAKLYADRKALDEHYQKRLSEIEKEMSEYVSEWRGANPNANRYEIYDDTIFNDLSLREDKIFDEWTTKGKKADLACKEAINRCLEEHDYDGVHLLSDEGSFGRTTETWIALSSNQVKSATDNIGLYDKQNPNIFFSRQSVTDPSELSDVQLGIIANITRRAAEKYGIRQLSQEEMKGVSLKQADIDARLRRQFRFDDVNQPTVFKDTNHNSLHLSDAVIFTSGEGANIGYGTGRILGFDNIGNVTIAVDSGAYGSQVTVPQSKVTFVAHNNAETVSRDYTSANLSYERAKTAFDNFGKSGEVRALGTFGFNEAQHYLFDSSEKLFALSKMMSLHNDGTDYGTGIGASRNNDAEWGEFDSFDYSSMSYRDLLLQYYDAVRNTNLAKDVSDLYIALGKETLDIEKMVANLKDVDSLNPFRKSSSIGNGSYMFNDVYRNFERVFGNYYDVVKPYLDNLDRSKGDYARNLIDKAILLSDICAKYNFKPGDDFDRAVQMYGEGSVHINLRKPKDRKLFKRLGLSEANFNFSKEFDVPIDDVSLIKLVSEERVGAVKECAKEFRQLYDEYLVRVNETIARIYPGQEERLIHPKDNYFRHFKEVTGSLVSLMQQLAEKAEIDPLLSGISQRTKPKKSFESYMQTRDGEETDYSAIKGFVDYIQQAEYTICINPHIKVFRELRQNLASHKSEQGSGNLNSFLNYVDTFANHLAKKTTGFDRMFTNHLGSSGRTILKNIGLLNNRIMQNNIVGNASVALKQVLNLPNGIVYLQKPSLLIKSTLGLFKALTADEKLMAKYDKQMSESNYLAERFVDKYLYKKKSGARKIAERITSVGDEFAVRALWLAAYEDAVRLDVPNPAIYADDIARKCSAGRGIGEKPIMFTEQTTKLILPYLLEGNNNWNVWRDLFKNTVKDRNKTGHEFDDRNSYLYYNNQKGAGKSMCSRSYRLALLLMVATGVGDLFEKLLGTRPMFDPINDYRKAFDQATKDNKDFDFKDFTNALINGSVNTAKNFSEHRNFGWVYSTVSSFLSDDPLKSNDSIMTSVPLGSAVTNFVKSMTKGDFIGAGLEAGTSFLMPFGGAQVKKSVKGLLDVANGGKYNNSATAMLGGSPAGGLRYEIEKSPSNFIKGGLFGTNSLPESQKYWDEMEAEKAIDIFKEDENAFKAFQTDFRSGKDQYHKALSRLQDKTGSDKALPYAEILASYEYESPAGETVSFELEPEDRKRYQDEINNKLDAKFREVCSSFSFKSADDKGRLDMLNKERKKIVESFEKNIINTHKYESYIKDYRAAHGDDEVMKLFDATKDYSLLPTADVGRTKEYTLDGNKYSFELTDEQMKYYSGLMSDEIEKEYALTVGKDGWQYKSKTTRKELLAKAKSKATERVGTYIKWDRVYGDAMKEFDAEHGEDNPVRQAYEYSHDATVYPYWFQEDTIKFQKDKKQWVYRISREPNSHGKDVEYEFLSEYINNQYVDKYVNIAIGRGYLDGKSPEDIYNTLTLYKKEISTELNKQLKEYVIGRAKLYPHQVEIE